MQDQPDIIKKPLSFCGGEQAKAEKTNGKTHREFISGDLAGLC